MPSLLSVPDITVSVEKSLETAIARPAEVGLSGLEAGMVDGSRETVSEERRHDFARRKKVSEMTGDELRLALLTSDKTGLGNERCYDEAEKKLFQASIDIDSLGWVNDNMGHLGGDRMLRAVGQAFSEESSDVYHLHGDEFVAQFDNERVGHEVLARVRNRLKGAVLTFTTPEGATITKTGIGLSYGIDRTFEQADARLYVDKASRADAGERVAKGHEPAGVYREPAGGSTIDRGSIAGSQIIEAVADGFHCGQVLSVADGMVTQKVSRDGRTVLHDVRALSAPVKVGDVIEVQYWGGMGEVAGGRKQKVAGIGR